MTADDHGDALAERTKSGSPEKIVLVKAKGGMGNRVMCLLTGILYGKLSRRQVLVDWRDDTYSDNSTNVFAHYFDCQNARPCDKLQRYNSVRPSIWNGNLDRSMTEMLDAFDPDKHSSPLIYRKYSVDVSRLDYAEDIVVIWSYTHKIEKLRRHFRGAFAEWAKLTDEEILHRLLRGELCPAEESRKRVVEFRRSKFGRLNIGVHVRYTDRKTPLGRYHRSLARVLREFPEANIFLATDNAQVQEKFKNTYQRVVVFDKWFPETQGTLHQNLDCPDRMAAGMEALSDMYLLAACDYLIYPRGSTFSYVSRLLAGLPDSRVCDVERWDPKVRTKRLISRIV